MICTTKGPHNTNLKICSFNNVWAPALWFISAINKTYDYDTKHVGQTESALLKNVYKFEIKKELIMFRQNVIMSSNISKLVTSHGLKLIQNFLVLSCIRDV